MLLLMVGAGALIFSLATPGKQDIERDKTTAAALEQAKTALIGYAAGLNYSGTERPGNLPCPDTSGTGNQDSSCNSAGLRIGRLPWKTLGLPDLRDGNGELLWYAVSDNFKKSTAIGTLNSDTPGNLTVTGNVPATNVIAIIFSPGPVVGSQDRNPVVSSTCATYGASRTNNLCPTNYLEGGNEDADTTFVTGLSSPTFNDRLLMITRETFFPAVEMRVAREIRSSLGSYYTANQFYPFAAPFPGNTATTGIYRGYVPTAATPACAPPTPDLTLPPWFATNNWQQYMVYAVAPRCTASIESNVSLTIALLAPPPPCATSCINLLLVQVCLLSQAVDAAALNCNNTGGYLTVDGTNNIRAIVLPASYRLGGQARPCAGMSDCLEAVAGNNENIDADNSYIKPVRSTTNNDNLVVVAP